MCLCQESFVFDTDTVSVVASDRSYLAAKQEIFMEMCASSKPADILISEMFMMIILPH